MADGVVITSGAASTPPNGTIIATDDAGASGQVQLVKLAYSANASATLIDADADGLRVNVDNAFALESTASSSSSALTAIQAAVETLDNAISGSEMQVDVVSGAVTATGTLDNSDSPTATTTAIGDAVTSTTLLAAATTRHGFSLRNLSTAILYVKYGSTATVADSHITALAQGERFGDAGIGLYTGIITGIWASDAGGSVIVTSW